MSGVTAIEPTLLQHFSALDFDPMGQGMGDVGDRTDSDAMVKAAQAHRCSHCVGPIRAGEEIRERHGKRDGERKTWRWCSACCQAMQEELHKELRASAVGDPFPFFTRFAKHA